MILAFVPEILGFPKSLLRSRNPLYTDLQLAGGVRLSAFIYFNCELLKRIFVSFVDL